MKKMKGFFVLLSNFLISFFPLSQAPFFFCKSFPPENGFKCRISFSNLLCCGAAKWNLIFHPNTHCMVVLVQAQLPYYHYPECAADVSSKAARALFLCGNLNYSLDLLRAHFLPPPTDATASVCAQTQTTQTLGTFSSRYTRPEIILVTGLVIFATAVARLVCPDLLG